jgi:tRNA(Ile2) C34 agmatinyltransferase TiaS
MTHLKCSECGGELQIIGKLLKCSQCGRTKDYRQEEKTHINEVDMNDVTKDMDVLID